MGVKQIVKPAGKRFMIIITAEGFLKEKRYRYQGIPFERLG